jgi:hypothetical protein
LVDDIGIFYRYAQNLASGHGWTYNIGQSDPGGITSPVYVLLLAGLSKLGLTIPFAGTVLWVAGITTGGASLYGAMRNIGHPVAGFTGGLLVVTSPWLVSVRGMESGLFVGLLAVSLWLYVGQRYVLCGVVLGLLVVTRPDGAFFALSLAVVHLYRYRRFPWRAAIPGTAVIAAWVIYAAIFVGQIVPDTLQSKIYSSRIEQSGSLFFFTGVWLNPRQFGFGTWAIAVGGLGAIGLIAWLIQIRRPNPIISILVLGTILFLVFYGIVLNLAPFYIWYFTPLVFTGCVLAGSALELLAGAFRSNAARGVLACSAILIAVAISVQGVLSTPPGWEALRAGYIPAAIWVRDHSTPDQTVASSEIGLIGWYSERPMIDYLGLFTPSLATKFFHRDWLYWVRRYQPDFYLVPRQPEWPWDQEVQDQPWFPSTFKIVYKDATVEVWKRVAPVPQH